MPLEFSRGTCAGQTRRREPRYCWVCWNLFRSSRFRSHKSPPGKQSLKHHLRDGSPLNGSRTECIPRQRPQLTRGEISRQLHNCRLQANDALPPYCIRRALCGILTTFPFVDRRTDRGRPKPATRPHESSFRSRLRTESPSTKYNSRGTIAHFAGYVSHVSMCYYH